MSRATALPESLLGKFALEHDERDSDQALAGLQHLWDTAATPVTLESLETLWHEQSPSGSLQLLHELIKYDQFRRIESGARADLNLYLEHFPELQADRRQLVSLAYSEFCALEDLGQKPETDAFCRKYHDLSDSLTAQFAIHQLLSIRSNELQNHECARHFPKVGQMVEHFQLERELGRGGTARVFLARDLNLGRRAVALKITGDQSTEPEILARLDHDHIVPVLSAQDTEEGLRLICMPFRGSITLERLFNRFFAQNAQKQRLSARDFRQFFDTSDNSPSENGLSAEGPEGGWKDFPAHGNLTIAIAWVGWKLASALAYAHTLKVYHRDIKPANILISRKSGPQLLDFNMARDPDALAQVEDRIRGGTLPYMAPEQLGAFLDPSLWAEICEQADIFSLGLVLQEWIRGRRVEIPLPASEPVKSQARALLRQRSQPWVSLRQENRQVSCALDAVMSKALAFEPFRRYETAQQFADDLKAVIDGKPLRWAWNPSRRERWLTATRPLRKYALAGLLLVGLFQWQRYSVGPQPLPVPGVSSTLVQLVGRKDYARAANIIAQAPASQAESAEMEIIRLIVWSVTNPSDEKAFLTIASLVRRDNLDDAMQNVRNAIGPDRQLDFLPLFRDLCRLNDLEQRKEKVAPLDWQNLERRFFETQGKWPEDMRFPYYLAALAAKRDDFQSAEIHIDRALDLFQKSLVSNNRKVRDDLRNKKISYQFQAATELQKANQPDDAYTKYQNCQNLISQYRQEMQQQVPAKPLEWLEIEISTIIGQGDCLTDKAKHTEAAVEYQKAQEMVDQNEAFLAEQGSLENLRIQLNNRFSTIPFRPNPPARGAK